MVVNKSIKISEETKKLLDKEKIHRETYDDIIKRLIEIKKSIEREIRNSGRSNMLSIDTIKEILENGR